MASNSQSSRNLLLDLPVEVLLTYVVSHLKNTDLAAMRRVNRALFELMSSMRTYALKRVAARRLCVDDAELSAFPKTIPKGRTLVVLNCAEGLRDVRALRGLLDSLGTIPLTHDDLDVRFGNSPAITDLTALRNVEVLAIACLDSLVDFSTLANGRLRFFSMRRCPLVRDLGALAGVETVDLEGEFDDLAPLRFSSYVRMNAADADISVPAEVRHLSLRGAFSDASSLARVTFLDLSNCANVRDVSALGGVHTLVLDACPVEDASALKGVRRLSQRRTPVRDVSMLGGLRELDIAQCTNVEDISALSSVEVLNAEGCEGLDSDMWRSDGYS